MDKPISFASKVTAPDNVLFRELEGEAVLLNLDNETYYGLDDVGTRMWAVVTTAPSIADVYAALLQEFDVAPDQLESDLRAWLDELLENGLLVLV